MAALEAANAEIARLEEKAPYFAFKRLNARQENEQTLFRFYVENIGEHTATEIYTEIFMYWGPRVTYAIGQNAGEIPKERLLLVEVDLSKEDLTGGDAMQFRVELKFTDKQTGKRAAAVFHHIWPPMINGVFNSHNLSFVNPAEMQALNIRTDIERAIATAGPVSFKIKDRL